MPARVMLSSVTKDDIPLGDIAQLQDFWYEVATLQERLQPRGHSLKTDLRISFTDARSELQRHLEGKYGFTVYNFQNTPADGGAPEKVTIAETHRSHMVIGVFGSQTGWKVPDQDPLTPTFREWRAALESPLKFKVFALKGSLSLPNAVRLSTPLHQLPGHAVTVVRGDLLARRTLARNHQSCDASKPNPPAKLGTTQAQSRAQAWNETGHKDRTVRSIL